MEPVAIPKATPGLDQSDAVGAAPVAQSTVAPELFEALLASAMPVEASAPTPAIPVNIVVNTAAAPTVEAADSMVAALSAASLTAQRGVQMAAETNAATPALITVTPDETADSQIPSLTVSLPTFETKSDDALTPQLVIKSDVVNHALTTRIIQTLPQTTETVSEFDAAVEAVQQLALETPIGTSTEPPQPETQPTPVIALAPGEVYGPTLPQCPAPATTPSPLVEAVDVSDSPAPTAIATSPELATSELEDHVTVKLETLDTTVQADVTPDVQMMMAALAAPHMQSTEARVSTQDDVSEQDDTVDTQDNSRQDISDDTAQAMRAQPQVFVIDPALASQLTVPAPPANMVNKDETSVPDLVNHRRATIDAPVILLKQADTAKVETRVTTPASKQATFDGEASAPVATYSPRPQSGSPTPDYGSGEARQDGANQQQPQQQKSTFTLTRPQPVTNKDDGMTITSDAVLPHAEDATVDIRALAKFDVREVEVSLASTPTTERLTGTTFVAGSETSSQAQNADAIPEQPQASSAGDDARRVAANEVRMRALERMVVNAAREGSDTIKMQLYPPGLGQIIIRLNMEGSRLRLSTRTSNTEATEALRNVEQGLRDALASSGLDLTQFDVSEDGEQRERASHQQADKTQPKRGNFSDEVFAIDMNA